jgi:SMI1 / KNR4 family (SUKH-1)
MQPAYQQLAQHWKLTFVNLAGDVSPEAIRAFEVSHQLAFPSDFREYLIHLGGMNGARGDETDSKLFSFWPLAEMRSVAAEYPGEEFPPNHPPSPDCCIVFADFMIDSHHFALRCAPAHPAARASVAGAGAGEIFFFGGNAVAKIADSFTQFVRIYISDDKAIYGANLEKAARR